MKSSRGADGNRVAGLFALVLATAILLLSGGRAAATVNYTSSYVWDSDRRLTMVIEPDPGTGVHAATRYVYDADSQLIETDKGTTPNTDGSSFTVVEKTLFTFDAGGRKTLTTVLNGTATPALAVSQTDYDADDRATCTAVRMNPANYGALPATACALPLPTPGSYGNDRLTQTIFDAAGQKTSEIRALGSSKQITYEAFTYTADGKTATIDDADGNRTSYVLDGYDRLITTQFPVTTPGQHASDATDYEAYTYDANDNRLSLRKRDASTLTYAYDNLNRETLKSAPAVGPAAAYQVTTVYDLLNHKLSALSAGGAGVTYSYDAAGRILTEAAGSLTLTSAYDAAGNRTQLTWPDGFYAGYLYDAGNHLTKVNENGATSGLGLLASYTYDGLGRRTNVADGNGAGAAYGFDNADRLTSLGMTMPSGGTAANDTIALVYNPASQILSRAGTNATYDYVNYASGTTNKAYDGLNRDGTIATLGTGPCPVGGANTSNPGYDANGSLLNDGVRAVCYDAENRLISAAIPSTSTTASLAYDPSGRLQTYQTVVSGTASTTTFLYDGDRLSAEYNGSTLLRRYVHGVGTDVPLVWYEGAVGSTDRRWLHTDNQGSVIAWSNGSGAVTTTSYGAYGEPASWSGSRFAYTGQIMLPEIKLYHYKARVYDPATGRFLQTDPVGYQDDADLYAYVRDDPVDKADPTGQCAAAANMAVGTSLTCSSPGASITPRREVEFQAKGPAPLVAGAVAAAAVWNGAEKIGEQVSAAASALTAKKEPNYVYRGLAPNDDPALGLFARNPFSAAAPSSHVNGKDDSPWISASKSLLVAAGKYGQYGVVQIDLNKVFYYIDVSNGVPNGWSKINNWAKADQEVLIYGYVPPYAITAVDKFSK